jgi:hypothetical protein
VVASGRDEVVLELETGGFTAEPHEDGTVRLDVPGYDLTADAGFPSLPVRRTWVDAIAGRKVKLVSVEVLEEEGYEGLVPWDAGEPVVEVTRRGTVRAARKRRPRKKARQASLYPTEPARLLRVGYQGDVKKALVELAPLRWDASANRLVLAQRLVVRIAFRGHDPADRTLDDRQGRRYRKRASHQKRSVVARLVTEEPGLYGVRYEDVFGGRQTRGVRPNALRLSRHGIAVAYHLLPDRSRFRPGSTLYFISEGARANPYGTEAVYELEVGIAGETMKVKAASPRGELTPQYWKTVEKEEDLLYQSTLLEAPDLWLWSQIFAPATKSFPFEVSAVADTAESSPLTVWLQGASDLEAEPDHHLRVYVNGRFVAESSWDGKSPHRMDADLLPGTLVMGENRLEVENLGDTEAEYSMVFLDRFRLRYPRWPRLQEGVIEGVWPESGTAEIEGLSHRAAVIEMGESGPVWLEALESRSTAVGFRVEEGRSYLAVNPEAVRTVAEVRKPPKMRWKQPGNRADYVMVGVSRCGQAACRASQEPATAGESSGRRRCFLGVRFRRGKDGSDTRFPRLCLPQLESGPTVRGSAG